MLQVFFSLNVFLNKSVAANYRQMWKRFAAAFLNGNREIFYK